MNYSIGFAIIGAGVIARFHARSIKALGRAELVGVFDNSRLHAERFAAEFGCRVFRTFDELLNCPAVQAVTIATPSGFHAETAIPCARAGKHIFCEKPLDITLAKADAMIAACEEAGVVLTTVFQSRFSPPVRQLKQAVESGRFGIMLMAGTQVHLFRDDAYYTGWHGTLAVDGGGALINQAIHLVDVLLYLNGDPELCLGVAGTRVHRIEAEDTLAATIRFKNGSFGTIEASTACAPGFPQRVELAGSQGSAAYEADSIVRWSFLDTRPEDAAVIARLGGRPGVSGVGRADDIAELIHLPQLTDFVEAIETGRPPLVDGREGRRSLALVCGIYESVRTGNPYRF